MAEVHLFILAEEVPIGGFFEPLSELLAFWRGAAKRANSERLEGRQTARIGIRWDYAKHSGRFSSVAGKKW